eukprot:EG_transcript_10564
MCGRKKARAGPAGCPRAATPPLTEERGPAADLRDETCYRGTLVASPKRPHVSRRRSGDTCCPEPPLAVYRGTLVVEDRFQPLPLQPRYDPASGRYVAQHCPPWAPGQALRVPLTRPQAKRAGRMWRCPECRGNMVRMAVPYVDHHSRYQSKHSLRCQRCGSEPEGSHPLISFLTIHDLNSLQPDTYVNDSVIEGYLQLLVTRSKHWLAQGRSVPRVLAFSTQFYTHLCAAGYAKVRREGGRRLDLFAAVDLLLIPINYPANHWTLAAVDLRTPHLGFYDSLGTSGVEHLTRIHKYLVKRNADLRADGKATVDWLDSSPPRRHFHCPRKTIPQQVGPDCGVFVCKYADCLAQDMSLTADPPPFGPEDMPTFRRRMVLELLCGFVP